MSNSNNVIIVVEDNDGLYSKMENHLSDLGITIKRAKDNKSLVNLPKTVYAKVFWIIADLYPMEIRADSQKEPIRYNQGGGLVDELRKKTKGNMQHVVGFRENTKSFEGIPGVSIFDKSDFEVSMKKILTLAEEFFVS